MHEEAIKFPNLIGRKNSSEGKERSGSMSGYGFFDSGAAAVEVSNPVVLIGKKLNNL